jgi:hypothetical protein
MSENTAPVEHETDAELYPVAHGLRESDPKLLPVDEGDADAEEAYRKSQEEA